MSTSFTVPMIAPDGSVADVPHDSVDSALQAGAKRAIEMVAPDGSRAHVPQGSDSFVAAMKAGARPAALMEKPRDKQKMGLLDTSMGVAGKVGDMVKGIYDMAQATANPTKMATQLVFGASNAAAHTPKDQYTTPMEPVAMAAGSLLGADTPALAQAIVNRDPGKALVESTPLLATAAAGPVTRGVIKGVDKLPSTARASANFDAVAKVANGLPVDVSEAMKSAIEAQRLHSNGAREIPPAIKALMEKGKNGSIPYEDARQIYSNAIDPDAIGKQSMNRSMKRQVTSSTKALDQSIRDTTTGAGVGDEYAAAMSEFRNAMRMKSMGKVLANAAKTAAIGGPTYYLLDALWRAHSGKR